MLTHVSEKLAASVIRVMRKAVGFSAASISIHNATRATSQKTVTLMVEWLTLLLLFGRSRIQISAQRPAILTDIFHDFPHSLRENVGIIT
jgi:hypothetical protein